jgi:hypothetical protein
MGSIRALIAGSASDFVKNSTERNDYSCKRCHPASIKSKERAPPELERKN